VFRMPLAGRHQVLNATAAIGLTLQLGGAIDKMQEALLSYTGVKRRLEFLGEAKEVQVFDDYAHHPKEIEVTLQALRQMVGGKRIVTVFQPHRFSRFAYHIEAFAKSLQLADLCIVTDIYSAREEPLPGIHAQNLLYYLPQARYLPKDSLMEQLVTYIAPGDVIVTFGAGDITYCGPLLLKYLRESSPHDSMVT
ncbi:MAG: UDP-N-acetylmuramate--L-alanine ligase, partial [Chlamydiae bacterium]|nr:UDP-N-acetylmuramate--L-alanine ligase [Chlamydiota bacterium]